MRVLNFNAGPAALPLPALERARDELLDFDHTGMSVMEQSHRGKAYEAVHNEAIALLRELSGIPASHEVLFVQGGATLQFALVPMNFLRPGQASDYLVTGVWGEKAVEAAQYVSPPRVLSFQEQGTYLRVPTPGDLAGLNPEAAYVHWTSNETIHGVQYPDVVDTGRVPSIVDMSSDFLWKKLDFSRYAFVYAGAQKNVGPSGIVVCVGDRDFIKSGRTDLPKILRYQTEVENNSLYNTPPTFSVYLIRNVLAWVKSVGGLEQMERWNREKAALVYGAIDRASGFYRAPVETQSRSLMNVVFRLPSEDLETRFVAEAKAENMVGLKGHRSVGGIRVSLYNAVCVSDARTLVAFMDRFAQVNG